MTTLDIYLWVQPILQVVVEGGMTAAIIWYVKWYITTLKGAIEAQEKTIAAQADQMKAQSESMKGLETLTSTMKAVLESTDERKMLERLKSYKAMVDEEQQLVLRQVEQSKNQLTERVTTATLNAVLPQFENAIKGLMDFAIKAIPFLPPVQRRAILDSVDIPSVYRLHIKDDLVRYANDAPDLTGPQSLTEGTLAELLGIPLQAKSERPPRGDQTH